ncbi:peptidase S8/S53 domain-containing protein [Zopfochytrium polystomum]|nr:peptidase S8/S53 domain-containing protein [Zopfochytrium polystomum]
MLLLALASAAAAVTATTAVLAATRSSDIAAALPDRGPAGPSGIIRLSSRILAPHIALVEFPPSQDCNAASRVSSVLNAKGVSFKPRTETNTSLFCGFSFELNDQSDAAADHVAPLQSGGATVHPIYSQKRIMKSGRTSAVATSAVELNASTIRDPIHSATGVYEAREKLGLDGRGSKIAIIDDGIYYKHPALGGCFGPGCRVAFGWDFIGDDYDTTQVLKPDGDPLNTCIEGSHGTSVAGVAAADGTNITAEGFVPAVPFSGVAPAATLGAYKIISCAGTFFTDFITAAIFRAAADGADVINMSFGGGQNYPDDITTIAADRVAANGHMVVGSAGNDQITGMFIASGPGQSAKAFSAAAFEPPEVWSNYLTIDGKEYQWSAADLLSNFSFPQALQVVPNNPHAIGNLSVLDDGCNFVSSAVKGKTAILQLGTVCGSQTACNNAAAAGAIACIMVSDVNFKGGWTGSDQIPTAGVELATGVLLATSPNATVVIYEKLKRMSTFGAPSVTSFSSPGLDPELHLKPDLAGIGEAIYTVISPIKSGSAYGFFGGTSAAAPYLSGSIALLLQQQRNRTFEELQAALLNNATPSPFFNATANPASPPFDPKVIDSVAIQGAGLVNVYNAAIAKTRVTPAKLGLNDTSRMLQSYSVTVENLNEKDIVYTVSHVKALTYAPLRTGEDAMLTQRQLHATTNQATVTLGDAGPDQPATYTVKARSNKTVTVRFTAPKALPGQRFPTFSGYLAVSNNLDATVQHVPYAGVVGNWTDAPVLAKQSTEFTPKVGCYEDEGGVTPVTSGFQFNGTDSQINCFVPISSTTRLLFAEVAYMGSNSTILQFLKDNGLSEPSFLGEPKRGVAAGVALMNGFVLWGVASRQTFLTFRVQTVGTPGKIQFWGDVAVPSTIVTTTAATSFNFTKVSLPAGDYKLRFKALKHFAPFSRLNDDESFDIVDVPTVKIVY